MNGQGERERERERLRTASGPPSMNGELQVDQKTGLFSGPSTTKSSEIVSRPFKDKVPRMFLNPWQESSQMFSRPFTKKVPLDEIGSRFFLDSWRKPVLRFISRPLSKKNIRFFLDPWRNKFPVLLSRPLTKKVPRCVLDPWRRKFPDVL